MGWLPRSGPNLESSTLDLNSAEARKKSIQRCLTMLKIHKVKKLLMHASQCTDSNCNTVPCKKIKMFIIHAKTCEQKFTGACSTCKQLVALCCRHATHCQDAECKVPFCITIRNNMQMPHGLMLHRIHQMRQRNAEAQRNAAQRVEIAAADSAAEGIALIEAQGGSFTPIESDTSNTNNSVDTSESDGEESDSATTTEKESDTD